MDSSINNGSFGKWEMVKKNKKAGMAGKMQNVKKGDGGRKALTEANMPKLYPSSPLKTSQTIFERFEKIGKKQNKEQVPPASFEQQQKKRNAGKMNKKPYSNENGQRSGKFKSLQEAFKALDIGDLQQQLQNSQRVFAENPSVWVKDLAGYLNSKLQAPDNDPTLSQHPYDYPYCLASKDLKNIIKTLLGKSPTAAEELFDHCIYSMLREYDKPNGEALYGYRICIQALLMEKPKIATLNLPSYLDLLRTYLNKPTKCLTIMWALGQAGFTDLSEGLKVWLGIMLPVLGTKMLSPYSIAYLDRLLMMHPNLTKGFGIIGPKDFFPLLDFAFMPGNALSPSLQDQLRRLYPRLKVLAFGASPESSLHTYFPSFLSRGTPHCPEGMKKELICSLTECLTFDPQCFSVWRQLYTKHLSQSSILLNHLLNSWGSLSGKVRKSLQETVQSFQVTNEEISLSTKSDHVKACAAVCTNLQLKMKRQRFNWSRLLLVGLVFAVGFVIHDIRAQGSFNGSSVAQVLQQSGMMSFSQQAYNKISVYSNKGYSWLETNAPYYYSEMVKTFGPTLEMAWEKTIVTSAYITEMCAGQIAWIKENAPKLIELLSASIPECVVNFIEYLKVLLLFIHQNYLPLMTYAVTLMDESWQTFVKSCNGEVSWLCVQNHLINFTDSSWSYLQNRSIAVKNWALDLISRHSSA
ncbi:transmembrane protein 214 [Polypterus senegalus]|uniref:transmembrane protein 214 n=1 Tax=Polypterus senegalus TaxID=55291 RepID=UPI0019624A00|nr:transmembrane protein 214 [Polypterus senegalus]